VIRAVLFDLGDTLWHFPNPPGRAAITAERAARIAARLRSWGLDARVDALALAQAILEAERAATSAAESSDGRSPDFVGIVQACAAAWELPLDREQSATLWHDLELGAFLGRTLFPDTIPLLKALQQRGYRLGTVTNRSIGGPPFVEELRATGLLAFFEVVAVSCDDGWLKPHPALFRKALDALDVPAPDAVMVGDSLRADVLGAKLLGMVAVWKRPSRGEQEPAHLPDGTPALPDYTIDHPAELLDLPPFRGS
jgi:HAD superfamily hydrolase (TIGR01549 family)